jgi:hypothetical protein
VVTRATGEVRQLSEEELLADFATSSANGLG